MTSQTGQPATGGQPTSQPIPASAGAPPRRTGHEPLRLLVVDDERPALDELAFLLRSDGRVGEILTSDSSTEALRILREVDVDAVFLDIAMPGLTGLDLAAVLARFARAPAIVFVTAHAEHAVDAFDLNAVDYLLKPVREERLREAVRRISETGAEQRPAGDDTIAVELGGVTRLVARSEVQYVEAQGDYSRLHTAQGSHLVRLPISSLEDRWRDAGFLRIHRSLLVALPHVEEIREDDGRVAVVVAGRELQVSRRHTPALREQLRRTRRAEP
ncbi:LytR/AlgR family response regulator transcription factor [Nocardioides sp. DS6]|uniref:LytR/AlgR family response regulator transcription factor n=1 Tax=Nocardioides eburneus TaxID=3231482 RepID=A0ABV3SY70_9ACTN